MEYKIIFAIITGYIANFLGGWDTMLNTLITFVIIDYMTGILAAIFLQKLSSAIGYKGIIKKIGIFAVVAVATMMDNCFGSELIRNITISFYLSNEGISILENVGKTGVKYPPKLKCILKQLKDDKKGGGKK
jgi:toxin secretion/phage lysis holin